MKHNLEEIQSALSKYDVNVTSRPDGSIVLTITHNERQLERVLDGSCSTREVNVILPSNRGHSFKHSSGPRRLAG